MKWNPPTQLPEDGQVCIIIAKDFPNEKSLYTMTCEFEKSKNLFLLIEGDDYISIKNIKAWISEDDLIEHFKRSQND